MYIKRMALQLDENNVLRYTWHIMIRSYKYRLYPNKVQVKLLERVLEIHRQIYNAALQERREAWKRCKVSVHYFDQCAQLKPIREFDEDVAWLNSVSCQQTLRRLDKTFQAFFRRVKAGQKPGYPRFKSRRRWRSVRYIFGNGIGLKNKRLRIQNVGLIKIKMHRPIPAEAKIKGIVITKQSDSKWYASFQIELPNPNPTSHVGPPIGIDLGVNPNLVALSNGKTVQAPRFFRKSESALAHAQRVVSRRKRGSNRRRKAVRNVAKIHRHIANQRLDLAHKLSQELVKDFSLIAVEDLNITGMLKNHCLAKSISDAGWGQLLRLLSYKVENTGSQIIAVNPAYTSQVCSGCGCIVKKDLSIRIHDCPHCGLVLDRDVNAAKNILTKAMARTEPSINSSTLVECS